LEYRPSSFQPLRDEVPMHPCNSNAVTQDEGVSRGVREALADPIVQALLAADRVNPQDVADLSRRIAARLSRRAAIDRGADA
jgi:hypothetical protein